jgi:hypothetical protein
LPAECNDDIHDKELLAVIKCIKEWHSELRGLKKPYTKLTDHKNLEPFTSKKILNERQIRWMEILEPLNFILKHRPGKASIIPDTLSRREQDIPKDATDSRLVHREKVLLPQSLWINQKNAIELVCPFSDDPKLMELWSEAIKSENIANNYLQTYLTI